MKKIKEEGNSIKIYKKNVKQGFLSYIS